jgi:hypothetical protein
VGAAAALMFRDPWFWAFVGILLLWIGRGVWRMVAEQRDFDRLARKWATMPQPTVTQDTMTITNLQLALRRLLVVMEDEHPRRAYGQLQVDEAKALLAGTDFEVR